MGPSQPALICRPDILCRPIKQQWEPQKLSGCWELPSRIMGVVVFLGPSSGQPPTLPGIPHSQSCVTSQSCKKITLIQIICKGHDGTSLVVQCVRIHLPMQETQVPSLL